MREINHSILTIIVFILTAFAIGLVILLDFGGWGGFLLAMGLSLLVQGSAALLLFGVLVGGAMLAIPPPRPALPNIALIIAFSFATLLALPLLPYVFDRALDLVDGLQCVILIAAFTLFMDPVYDYLGEFAWNLTQPAYTPPPPAPFAEVDDEWEPFLDPRPHLEANANYQHLLTIARGDRETVERLIDIERARAPHESKEALIERALDKLLAR